MNIFWNLTSQRRAESARKPSVVKSYCHTLPILIELPIELVSEIVSRLSFEDLLNLRASSRALDTLIREDGLLKPWVKRHVRPIQAQFSPVPSLQLWNHILKQERSWSLVQNTASIMVNYINRKVLLHLFLKTRLIVLPTTGYRAAQLNLKNQDVLDHIKEELTRRLFMLDHYLRSCKSRLLLDLHKVSQSSDWTALTPSAFESCATHTESYTPFSDQQLQDIHSAWLFTVDTLRILIERPHYMGTLEAFLRGLNEQCLDSDTLALSLVLGGCRTIKSLYQLGNFCARKKWVLNSLSGIPAPIRDNLLGKTGDKFAEYRGLLDSLWVEGMLATSKYRELPVENVILKATTRTTIQLLRDLAGFDLFASEEIVEPVMHTDMFGMPR